MDSSVSPLHSGQAAESMEMTDRGLKNVPQFDITSPDDDSENQDIHDGFKSTSGDAADMQRMGKKQELIRQFRTFSMASFVAIATAGWELPIFNLTAGLTNGGLAMLVWSQIWSFVLFTPIYLSMAEMASIAPVAGAQYRKYFFSYFFSIPSASMS